MRGLVLGGTKSGVGKTVATLATIRALESAGRTVQPAKAGPDFIDPSHHETVSERRSRTLDCWLQGPEGLRRNYHRGDGDVCVVEGVMGTYDGDASSTAAVAAALELPVVLVVDAAAGMESVAATALGFRAYADRIGPDVDVVGVLAQRAHGGRHERGIREALPDELEYFGRIPPRDALEIPDRHLGLEMGPDAAVDPDALEEAAATLHADRLLDVARTPPAVDTSPAADRSEPGPRVAVARDEAFCFRYPATVERLRERATVRTFSPVAGDGLPDCDGVYLPGGYPESHAETLASSPALADIAERAPGGLAVLGECGGLMALAETLHDGEDEHEMAGVLPARVRMHDRHQALDHVELEAGTGAPFAPPGTVFRGHEFHYSSAEVGRDARLSFDVRRGDGITGDRDGLTEYRTVGTYAHVHPASGAFDAFLDAL
ncbi:MAG: cobyrinic acid a,c-diamide synthase [Salinirussus sp.]